MANGATNLLTSIDVQQATIAAARKRRAQALALHDDGLTMKQIAGIMGVTVQRVSAMLKKARKDRE